METKDAFGSLPESGEKEYVSEPRQGLLPTCPASPSPPCPKQPFQQTRSPEREVWESWGRAQGACPFSGHRPSLEDWPGETSKPRAEVLGTWPASAGLREGPKVVGGAM